MSREVGRIPSQVRVLVLVLVDLVGPTILGALCTGYYADEKHDIG